MAVSLLLLPGSLISGIQRSGSSWTMLVTATPTNCRQTVKGPRRHLEAHTNTCIHA